MTITKILASISIAGALVRQSLLPSAIAPGKLARCGKSMGAWYCPAMRRSMRSSLRFDGQLRRPKTNDLESSATFLIPRLLPSALLISNSLLIGFYSVPVELECLSLLWVGIRHPYSKC